MDTRTGKKTYTPNVILRRAFQKRKYRLPRVKYIPDPKGIFVDGKGRAYSVKYYPGHRKDRGGDKECFMRG